MATPHADPARRAGPILATWVLLLLLIHAADWLAGPRAADLARAVERGEARVEAQSLGADLSADAARKAIGLQRATRPFWATLALLGDFAVDPLLLVARPLLVATLFAAWAALAGRPSGFGPALRQSAWVQGLWLVGPALALILALAPARPAAAAPDTSLGLLLGPGPHSAWTYATLRAADLFALWGWLALAWLGWRRRQVAPGVALAIVLPLLLVEVAARGAASALLGAGMRLTILPG